MRWLDAWTLAIGSSLLEFAEIMYRNKDGDECGYEPLGRSIPTPTVSATDAAATLTRDHGFEVSDVRKVRKVQLDYRYV